MATDTNLPEVGTKNHVYAAPGQRTITITDETDSTRTRSVTVTLPLPAAVVPQIVALEDTADATHKTVKVTVSNRVAGHTYEVRWDGASGAFTQDVPADGVSHAYAVDGAHTITVRDKVDTAKVASVGITTPMGPTFSLAEEPGDVNRRTVRLTVTNPIAGRTHEVRWLAGGVFEDVPVVGGVPTMTHAYTAGQAGANVVTVRDKATPTLTTDKQVTIPFTG